MTTDSLQSRQKLIQLLYTHIQYMQQRLRQPNRHTYISITTKISDKSENLVC